MNSTHTLGNIAEDSLLDIWNGQRTRDLRRALERSDLDLGCGVCRWQVEAGRSHLAYLKWFQEFPIESPDPEWPVQLELSISNTCNLQCVMCNGEWSSSIRSQRERRPPLASVYGESFFEDLRQFVPHLRRVKFLGGEPFLAAETLRIMELMVEVGAQAECHVTTNATHWTPRVEHILELLPVDVAVSLDAATAATYESIRVGSSWEMVQRNLDRFQEWARRCERSLTLTFCLMTVNWREFAAFCLAADDRGVECTVNTVTHPDELSLYHLPVTELEAVVRELEAMDAAEARSMTLSFSTWTGELERLRAHLADLRDEVKVAGIDRHPADELLPGRAKQLRNDGRIAELVAEADRLRAEHLPPGSVRLRTDPDDLIVAIDSVTDVLGVPVRKVRGEPLDRLTELVQLEAGAILHSITLADVEAARVLDVNYPGDRTMRVVLAPAYGGDGVSTGMWVDLAWLP